MSELDGPFALPIIGNLHQIRLDRVHRQFEDWAGRYGKLYRARFGPYIAAVLSDTETIRRILNQRPNLFRRTRLLRLTFEEMGLDGVFAAEGDDWRRQRRIVVSALMQARLKPFYPKIRTLAGRLQARWERAADRRETVDLCRDLMRFTVDVTAWLAFGADFNTLETDGPTIQQHLDKVFPVLHRRVGAPYRYWRYFRLPSDRALDRALEQVRIQAGTIIQEARERLAADPTRREAPENFLEALIVAGDREDEAGSRFSDAEILANVVTLLLAGEDTTANSMAWMVDDFIRHPEHFARARAEADAMIAPDPIAADIDVTNQLPFLDAFCNESMRLRPVAPWSEVEAIEDVEILGYLIPKDTAIIMLNRLVATRDENFDEGAQFDPGRWLLKPAERNVPHNSRASMPFGAGPRLCPGRSLALLQIRTVIGMLCRNFDVEPASPGQVVSERLAFTMIPTGLQVRFKRRQPHVTGHTATF